MRYFYSLRIAGADSEEVSRILQVAPTSDLGDWAYELEEEPSASPLPFVDTLLNMLEGKSEALESIGVRSDDVSLWVLYEYDEQCNLEFSPFDLRHIGEAGVTLCISAWQRKAHEQ